MHLLLNSEKGFHTPCPQFMTCNRFKTGALIRLKHIFDFQRTKIISSSLMQLRDVSAKILCHCSKGKRNIPADRWLIDANSEAPKAKAFSEEFMSKSMALLIATVTHRLRDRQECVCHLP